MGDIDFQKYKRMGIDIPVTPSTWGGKLDNRQKRMLEILINQQMAECNFCSNYPNVFIDSYVPPYIGDQYRGIMLLGEAPGRDEVRTGKPFVGAAGRILWDSMKKQGFHYDDFIIWNTMNCRPVKNNGLNAKPTEDTIEECGNWFRKAILIAKPTLLVALGGYAIKAIPGLSFRGVKRMCGRVELVEGIYDSFDLPVMHGIHPASCIYDPSNLAYLERMIESITSLQREL